MKIKNTLKKSSKKTLKLLKSIDKISGGAGISFTPNLRDVLVSDDYSEEYSEEYELNIQFIKNKIRYSNVANNNLKSKENNFNTLLKELKLEDTMFETLINYNYNKGRKMITNIKDSNKILIDLHGSAENNIFQLPKNINIVFLSSLNYSNCLDNIEKDNINLYIDQYLDNPFCFEDLKIKNIFNEAIIYYGGQYCPEIDLGRKDKDSVSGMHVLGERLGPSIAYGSKIYDILLSELLLNDYFNSEETYTIVLTACRNLSSLNKIIETYLLIWYEQLINLLNFKIYYDSKYKYNDNDNDNDKKSLDTFYKKCLSISSKFVISNNQYGVFQKQFLNTNKNTRGNYYPRPKSRKTITINTNTLINLIYNEKNYKTITDVHKFISENNINEHNKTDFFKKLYNALKFKKYNINNTNSKLSISIYNKNIIDIIILLFTPNYTLMFEFVMFCQMNISYLNMFLLVYFLIKIKDNKKNIDINNIVENISVPLNYSMLLFIINNFNTFDIRQVNKPDYVNLDIKNSTIKDKNIKIISELLLKLPKIITITISNNEISLQDHKNLIDVLINNTSLTDITLEKNSMVDECAIYLAHLLLNNKTLKILNISFNEIGDSGAIALAEALKDNTSLIDLNISLNEIGDIGASALAKALKNNTTLTNLNISSNEDKSIKNLADLAKLAELEN